MPPEYSPTRRPPSAVRPMNSNASADARLLLAVWQVVEFGEDEQVLVTGERTVHGDRLRHITDGAANADRLGGDGETGHARLARGGRQQRGEHLDRGGLARPVGAEQDRRPRRR